MAARDDGHHLAGADDIGAGQAADPGDVDAHEAPDLVLAEEKLRLGHEWVAVERVRLRRRVVVEEVLVPVTIRREELVIEQEPFADPLLAIDGPGPGYQPPIVIILHEEVPVVSLSRRAYERVTATIRTVRSAQRLTTELRRERVDVRVDPPLPHTPT